MPLPPRGVPQGGRYRSGASRVIVDLFLLFRQKIEQQRGQPVSL